MRDRALITSVAAGAVLAARLAVEPLYGWGVIVCAG
jgi:hypothetical protein